MWGHPDGCGCPVCTSFRRLGPLIREGTRLPGFILIVGDKLRVLEGEVRDLLQRPHAPGPPDFPVPVRGEFTPSAIPEEELNPAFAKGAVTPPAPRTDPSSPPKPPAQEVPQLPEEPKGESSKEEAEEKKEEPPTKEPKESKEKEPRKKKKKSHKQKEKKKLSRPSGSSSPPQAGSSRPRQRERSRRKRSREDSRTPSQGGGKEKKSRPDRPPEPKDPPKVRRDHLGTTPAPKNGGRGWIGPIPYSDHPRWHKPRAKGITKVIKQEYRDRQQRRGWRY